jgi:hypothetical protein
MEKTTVTFVRWIMGLPGAAKASAAVLAAIVAAVLYVQHVEASAYARGLAAGRAEVATRLAVASAESSTLRDSLWIALHTVRADTVRVDSVVTRWRVRRDVDTITNVDTLRQLVRVADTVIVTVDASRRQCLSVLPTCEEAVAAEKRRGDLAVVHYQQREQSEHKRRTVERIAWGVAFVGAVTWGATR